MLAVATLAVSPPGESYNILREVTQDPEGWSSPGTPLHLSIFPKGRRHHYTTLERRSP